MNLSERMPLARQLLAVGELNPDTVLFDVQVAWDLVWRDKVMEGSKLGPVRLPFPSMFMEWSLPEGVDEIARVGVRTTEIDADTILLEPGYFNDSGKALKYTMGYQIGLDADGRFDSVTRVGLYGYEVREGDAVEGLMELLISPVLMALSLINCRNVTTEQLGSIKMRRSGAEKRRGVPARDVRYNTIVLPGGGSQRVGSGSSTHHRASALHKVRGHFKTYTAERPLMGHVVGTFWWGWQVRGNAENGTVVSDYKVGATQE